MCVTYPENTIYDMACNCGKKKRIVKPEPNTKTSDKTERELYIEKVAQVRRKFGLPE